MVFVAEEWQDVPTRRDGIVEPAHIAARAEAPPLRMVDQNQADARIVHPIQKGGRHHAAHGVRQRMQGVRPVEGKPPDVVLNSDQEIVHGPNSSRAMMTRMISLVPSRI